jgi:hypothetical protein
MRRGQRRVRVSITKGRRRLALLGALPATVAIAAGTYVAPAVAASCPNEQLRQESNSTQLVDCRAYELVSPVEKNGWDVTLGGGVRSSVSGQAVAYESFGALPSSASAGVVNDYLATVGAGGWATTAIDPPLSPTFGQIIQGVVGYAFTPELDHYLFASPNPPLTSGAEPEVESLYVRNNADGSYSLETPPGRVLPFPEYNEGLSGVEASSSLGHVVFSSRASYTTDAPVGEAFKLYDSFDGVTRLVSYLPDGSVATESTEPGGAINGPSYRENAVSEDGSRIFFSEPGSGRIFARLNDDSTVEVSKSQRTTPDPNGHKPAAYRTASADGSTVFFISSEELTDDANTGVADEGTDLYAYNVESGVLTDLSVDTGADVNGAEAQGVVGTSADGSYVYFVANGRLVPEKGVAGQPNLYLWHDGALVYITTLATSDSEDWTAFFEGYASTRRVTRDGRTLAITTRSSQPGYENAGHSEIYLYNADAASFVCTSCEPSDVPATGDAALSPAQNDGSGTLYLPRNLSDEGTKLYFNSTQALVPEDIDGTTDVYEWEGGSDHLISPGTGSSESIFGDASESDGDVFFMTRDQLVSQDQDSNVDVYDARVDGGFPASATSTVPCQGEACQGQPTSPPALSSPSSASVSGAGNLAAPATTPPVKKTAKPSTRAQQLAKALKACRKKPKKLRPACEKQARQRFGPRKPAKKSNRRAGR